MSAPPPAYSEPTGDRADELRNFLDALELKPDRLARFDQALTHSSYANQAGLPGDFERLEFFGDSVLGFTIADWLFRESPNAGEGELSKRKAVLVSRRLLQRRAREIGMEPVVRLGRGDAENSARRRTSILGSALEALIGAAYLELPFEDVQRFIIEQIARPSLDIAQETELQDYKSRLQELTHQLRGAAPEYRLISQTGPDHDKRFVAEVELEGEVIGQGEGRRRKSAENMAAKEAMEKLKEH